MTTHFHDGSVEGVLAAMAAAWAEGPAGDVARSPDDLPLLAAPVDAPDGATAEAAERFLATIRERCGGRWPRRMVRLAASADPGAGRAALALWRLAADLGPAVDGYRAHPVVRRALQMEADVAREAHRLKGLLRFRRLASGRLWGPIEPRHNVTPMLAAHFTVRMARDAWLIHDVGRAAAVGWDPPGPARPWTPEEVAAELTAGLDASESQFQELWRAYFRATAIRARTNPTAQRRNMPLRYWRYLVERPGSAYDR